MTREEAKEFYPILQAYAEGKVIECRTKPSAMKCADTPNDWTEMKEIEFWSNIEYRIKPESKYRPFESAQECIEEMRKHEPFGWINYKVRNICSYVNAVSNTEVRISNIKRANTWYTFEVIFKNHVFFDGSPFGVKVEDEEE